MRRITFVLLIAAATVAGCAQHYPILAVPDSPHGIFTMMQDSRSALWLGTIDDVYSFDGQQFYSLRQYGFPKETPNSLAEDSDGGIWIGTQGTSANGGSGYGGLYRYRSGRVQKIFSGDNLGVVAVAPGIILASFATEANGKPAFGDLYLFHSSGSNWVPAPLAKQQADHLSLDHEGNALFPCPGGWCEIAHQQLLRLAGSNDPVNLVRHEGSPLLERVLRDRYGCLWFRAEAFASYQCASDKQPTVISKDISGYDSSDHLEETSDGSIFMLVKMALGRPGSFRTAVSEDGLPANLDTALVARDGTIWIGAATGLYRFMYPFRVQSWGKQDGIAEPAAILRTRDSGLFVSDGHVAKFDGARSRWDRIPGISAVEWLSAGPDKTLFGLGGNRILQFDAKGHVLASGEIPVNSAGDVSLATGPAGEVLLGLNGLSRVVRQDHDLVLKREPLPERSSGSIVYDAPHDTLWTCNGRDIAFRKAGVWGRITHQDGLLDAGCSRIAVDESGDLWMGYVTNAHAWIRNPASGHPIISNHTQWLNRIVQNGGNHFLSIDQRGWLWSGTDVLHVATAEAAKAGEWILLDERDGIAPPQVPGSAFLADPNGSVWFGTVAGITHFLPPPSFLTDFSAPPVFVAGFTSAKGGPTLVDAVTSIPRGTDITAHIGSLQFDRRNAIHLRYRFLPGQKSWTETNNFDLPLGKLGWRRRTLQVQAQLATGPWSPVVEQTLSVEWPIWLSWPLLLLYGATGTGLGAGVTHWRKKRKFERELSLPDLSSWRMSALTPETESLIGTLVDDRYEIGHVLSVGGFATVVRARDLDNEGQLCAVKIFRYEFGNRAWIRHRFEQEILALEQLSHPNVVRITGHGTIDTGAPYLVMEFIHGKTLREHLDKGALPRPQVGIFLHQIAGALYSLHERAIYHRDLKPDNLMVRAGENGQPEIVLIDFSIAIVKSRDQTFHGISRVAGTLEYMAPEQVIGFADASTDIYALAKIVMEMLAGLRWIDLFPEAALDLPEQIRNYFERSAILLSADSVDHIVWAMAFDPAGRPKDVLEFVRPIVRDLEQIP